MLSVKRDITSEKQNFQEKWFIEKSIFCVRIIEKVKIEFFGHEVPFNCPDHIWWIIPLFRIINVLFSGAPIITCSLFVCFMRPYVEIWVRLKYYKFLLIWVIKYEKKTHTHICRRGCNGWILKSFVYCYYACAPDTVCSVPHFTPTSHAM